MTERRAIRGAVLAAVASFVMTWGLVLAFPAPLADLVWSTTRASQIVYRLDPTTERAYELGVYHLDARNYGYNIDLAEYYIDEVRRRDGAYELTQFHAARIAFLRGDFDEALRRLNRHIRLRGDVHPTAWYLKGLIRAYNKNYTAAADDFEHFLSLKPNSWAGLNDYAWVLVEIEDWAKADRITQYAATIYVDNPWVLNTRGVVLSELGRAQEARAYFERAYAEVLSLQIEDWLAAYPGNDPRIADVGIAEFREAVLANINSTQLAE